MERGKGRDGEREEGRERERGRERGGKREGREVSVTMVKCITTIEHESSTIITLILTVPFLITETSVFDLTMS